MEFLNIHFTNLPPERERFDTLLAPSGTVATLNQIALENGVNARGYDAAFPDTEVVNEAIRADIEDILIRDEMPILLLTNLIYNAEENLRRSADLKRDFGDRIKIVLGGQLVPFATKAYLANPNIDSVSIGDGEIIIPKIIRDIRGRGELAKKYSDWLRDSSKKGHFSFVNYDQFYALEDRMVEQERVAGFSQLCIQGLGGPGCSWAAGNKNGACDFCALQNITEMNTRTIKQQMEAEKRLQDKFKPDRFFDVANQFLPFLDPKKNVQWLKQYIEVRNEYGVTSSKYAYLTVASINEEIAELLNKAGIEEVYLGVDHFDTEALKAENKSHRTQRRLERTLSALKNNGINVRMGLVLGSSPETQRSLQSLREGVKWLKDNYIEIVKALAIFPIYVLPGSKVYKRAFEEIPEARKIIESFQAKGYFTAEEEQALARTYMQKYSEVDPQEILKTMGELQQMAEEDTIAYNFQQSPGAEAIER